MNAPGLTPWHSLWNELARDPHWDFADDDESIEVVPAPLAAPAPTASRHHQQET